MNRLAFIGLTFLSLAGPARLFAAAKDPEAAPFTNVTASQIQANWTLHDSTSIATTFTAVLSTASSPSTNGASGNKSLTVTGLSALFTGLSPNTRYFADVSAHDTTGTSRVVALGSVPTLALAPTSAAPTNIQTGQITAHWDANGNPAGTTYIVQASTDAGFGIVAQSISTTSVSATLTGLSASTLYFMRVQAVNLNLIGTAFTSLPSATTLGNPPAVPGAAGFSNVSTTQVQANWTANGNPAGTSYTAILSTAPSPSTNGAAGNRTMTVTTLSAVFTTLNVNQLFYVEVKSFNGGGSSAFTALGSVATLANAPTSAAPSNIQTSQITANWGANGNPAGTIYLAQASTDAGFASIVTAISTPSLSATFTGLSASTPYFMRVQALNQDSVSTTFTTLPSATTLAPQAGAPGAAGFSNITTTQIQPNWTANGNPAGTIYTAILSTAPSPSTNGAAGNSTVTTTSLFTVFTTLAVNGFYFVEVQATTSGGPSPFTNLGSVATLANAPTSAAPSAIQGSQITANWGVDGNPVGTAYLAQLSTDAGFASLVTAISTTSHAATFTGLSFGTSYFMRVRAINRSEVSSAFTLLPSATTLGAPPTVPGASSFSNISATQIQANWTANGNPAGTNYTAILSVAPSPASNGLAANQTITSTSLSAVFTGLAVNQLYYAAVKSSNAGGSSTFTDLGSIPTLATLPTAGTPSQIQANQITANWGANGNPAGTTYQAQLSLDPSLNPLIDAVVTQQTSATFHGLSANTLYYMQVKAINQAGQPTASIPLPSAKTVIDTPESSDFAASQITDSSIIWTWVPIPNSAGYRVINENGLNVSGDLSSGAVQWLDSGLAVNTAYQRSLVAFNASGASTSTLITAFTLAHQPTELAAQALTSNSVSLSWNPNGNPLATQYTAQLVSASGPPHGLTVTGTQAIFEELDGATTYFCSVRAINGAGTAAGSAELVTVVTPAQLVALHQICPAGESTLAFNSPKGTVKIDVPANGFSQCIQLTAKIPGAFPEAPSSGTPLQGTGVGLELLTDLSIQPLLPITLTIPFNGTSVSADERSRLVLARYDSVHNAWVMLPSSVHAEDNGVTAQTNHLSLYQIMVALPSTGLSGINVYPNPLRPAIGHQAMHFANLPADATIEIYTLSGEKVRDLSATPAGTASWDGLNQSGRTAASGIYFAVVKSGGDKKILKLAVQR